MRISDWSSDVCSSDLHAVLEQAVDRPLVGAGHHHQAAILLGHLVQHQQGGDPVVVGVRRIGAVLVVGHLGVRTGQFHVDRSEEHTSELQSLMRISSAVFRLKKKNLYETFSLKKT